MTLFQELLVIEASKPRFAHTYCSQCGGEFGPGDEGFSHCSDHRGHNDALEQLKRLPQPIGINGGAYTYWVDVTKTPLKFTASDGSEVDEAKSLEDIARWMNKSKAELWLEFLNGDESLEMLQDEGLIRRKRGAGDQQEHEAYR